MSETSREFQTARLKYGSLLRQTMQYFLEDDGEADAVTNGALDQAARQWSALEGEANVLHVIALAAQDQCELLLPRAADQPARRVPTAKQIVRHFEWYAWEKRAEQTKLKISVLRASFAEAGFPETDSEELRGLEALYDQLINEQFRVQLGLDNDEDDLAGGGMACAIKSPPPGRGPGEKRTFEEALAVARNP